MGWWAVMQVVSTLIEWIRIGRLSEQEKDLEILVWRKQLARRAAVGHTSAAVAG